MQFSSLYFFFFFYHFLRVILPGSKGMTFLTFLMHIVGVHYALDYFANLGENQYLIVFSLIISETVSLCRVWFLGNKIIA